MSVIAVDVGLCRGGFKLDAYFESPLDGVTALFGPSGAGKSLLLGAIAGLARLDRGTISLNGRVLSSADSCTPPHARGIGLVFQDARLFPHLSVRGNLDFAARRAPRVLLTLDEAVAIFDLASFLDRPIRNLSGGERSRAALARALLSAPDLLLLDEPFAALDGARRQTFLHAIRAIHQRFELPMIVVTHQIEDAAHVASHLVGLDKGAVIGSGEIQATAASPAFQALLAPRDAGVMLPLSRLHGQTGTSAAGAWVRADAVLLATQAPQGLSARNVWNGRIKEITLDAGSRLVRVETELGDVLARITIEAAEELRLTAGAQVWAIVKTHAL
jgi:molybdate transport system ATP-binding protein